MNEGNKKKKKTPGCGCVQYHQGRILAEQCYLGATVNLDSKGFGKGNSKCNFYVEKLCLSFRSFLNVRPSRTHHGHHIQNHPSTDAPLPTKRPTPRYETIQRSIRLPSHRTNDASQPSKLLYIFAPAFARQSASWLRALGTFFHKTCTPLSASISTSLTTLRMYFEFVMALPLFLLV